MMKVLGAALLAVAAGGGPVALHGSSSLASVARVQDTLRSLLRSIQDDGRNAEKLFSKRHRWCETSMQALASRSDEFHFRADRLRADLAEQQAAAEEARSAAQQLRAEIALVQHTTTVIEDVENSNSTAIPPQALTQLLEKRRLSLPSLQEELKIVLPALSQLQAEAVETQRQIEDQNASAASVELFAKMLRSGCAASRKRADSQANARVGEATTVERALQALAKIGNIPVSGGGGNALAEEDEASDDQENLIDSAAVALFQVATSAQEEVVSEAPLLDENVVPTKVSGRAAVSPQPGVLLSRVEAEGEDAPAARRVWCEKEESRNKQVLDLAHAAAARATAEERAHADAEADVQERLDGVQSQSVEFTAMAKEVANSTATELMLLDTATRDQALATKILRQAGAILHSVDVGGQGTSSTQALLEAAQEVSTASDAFEAQAKTLKTMHRAVKAYSDRLASAADDVSSNLAKERRNLQMAQNSHSSLRARSKKSRQSHEAEAKATEEFLRRLTNGCKGVGSKQEENRRGVEIHALEDARRVLEGQGVQLTDDDGEQAGGLRGTRRKAAVDVSKLSPIERAALEMGLSADGN